MQVDRDRSRRFIVDLLYMLRISDFAGSLTGFLAE
jgi:hypothetical protein